MNIKLELRESKLENDKHYVELAINDILSLDELEDLEIHLTDIINQLYCYRKQHQMD